MSVLRYKGIRFASSGTETVEDGLAVEGALRISLNGEVFTITMRTPGNDEALLRGLLFTEDVYKNRDVHPQTSISSIDNLGNPTEINVVVEKEYLGSQYLTKRNLLSVSSCGICGKTELPEVTSDSNGFQESIELFNPELIQVLFQRMNDKQGTFKQSGGSHASAAFTLDGRLLSIQEDIGRHNAVDKVIGDLLLNGKLNDAKILLVSGRISYEIVSKCFMAHIPVLAAVSAPSSLAVDYAKELGITLLAFCREDYFTVYAHPERIKKLEMV